MESNRERQRATLIKMFYRVAHRITKSDGGVKRITEKVSEKVMEYCKVWQRMTNNHKSDT